MVEHTMDVSGWLRKQLEEASPDLLREMVKEFAEAYPRAALLLTGVEDPDGRAHGENESLHLGEFERACVAEALLLGYAKDVGEPSFPL